MIRYWCREYPSWIRNSLEKDFHYIPFYEFVVYHEFNVLKQHEVHLKKYHWFQPRVCDQSNDIPTTLQSMIKE